jgi:outer membrane protein assembly factor BamB
MVGQGRGDDEVLRKGKYLAAPAYRDGRVYAVALHRGDYRLLCLDAGDGSLVWKSSVIAGGLREVFAAGQGEVAFDVPDRTAPPALVGDRLYLLATGAVGAYDVRTGEPLWAYEYPVERQRRGAGPGAGTVVGRPRYNVSPLVVAGDRVICAPPDSQAILALSARDGQLLWQKDRGGHMDLSAIDANTVLLSGFDPGDRAANPIAGQLDGYKQLEAELAKDPQKNKAALEMIRKQIRDLTPASQADVHPPSMVLVDAASGEVVWRAPADCRVVGRPAVTATEVLASGSGKIYRLRLSDRTLTAVDVSEASACLGNLLSWRGKLYAANAWGITAYGEK